VSSKIRKDFGAGVAQSDEEILNVMKELMVQAGNQIAMRGGTLDAAAVMVARKLQSQ
jgi:hypothetical protein